MYFSLFVFFESIKEEFGQQSIVGSIDLKKESMNNYSIFTNCGSYKKYDDYGKALNSGHYSRMMSPSCIAVINTKLDETHGDFIKIFWDVKAGAEYLTYLRNGK